MCPVAHLSLCLLHPVLAVQNGEHPLKGCVAHGLSISFAVCPLVARHEVNVIVRASDHILNFNLGQGQRLGQGKWRSSNASSTQPSFARHRSRVART